jgi:hypothetical protein
MDVGALYGRRAPNLTNRTKTPVFLTPGGQEEKVQWEEEGKSYEQGYEKISEVNTSWQNLAVLPDRLGQSKKKSDLIPGTTRRETADMVDKRRDVLYSKGTLFRALHPFQLALLVLLLWAAGCYATILLSLQKRQTGK